MRTTELDRETEKATEPAKAWRLKWWTDGPVLCGDCMQVHGPDEFFGHSAYPSREIADQRASELLEHNQRVSKCMYLGAFPVSE